MSIRTPPEPGHNRITAPSSIESSVFVQDIATADVSHRSASQDLRPCHNSARHVVPRHAALPSEVHKSEHMTTGHSVET